MFEAFDLKAFGKHLRELRKSLKYTQKDIEKLSRITVDTLRRIETGSVLPRYDTLVYLSLALKKDLLEDLKSYRNSSSLFDYYARLDHLILNYDINVLRTLEDDFKHHCKDKPDDHFLDTNIKNQFKLILSGISILNSDTPQASLNVFIDAIKITSPFFEIDNFKGLKYSFFETRILILIAHALGENELYKQSNDIFESCLLNSNFDLESTSNEKLMIINTYYNLSLNAHIEDHYPLVIKYADEGIHYCSTHHISYGLPQLLFRKCIAEFNSKTGNYMSSLKRSISVLLINDNDKLAKIYADTAKQMYGIDINITTL